MKITAIYGPNGCGKTQYVERLRRQMASDRVRYVAFRDSYGVATDQAYYLQLRWNQHDIDAETPTVAQLLEKAFRETGDDTPERRQWQQHLYQLFQLEPLLDKYIITLSSGELRKFQLARTLLAQPRTLIIDNPFIGLDAETRDQLRTLLKELGTTHDLHIYIVVARRKDIPDYVTDIVDLTPEATDDQVVIASTTSPSATASVPSSRTSTGPSVRASTGHSPDRTVPASRRCCRSSVPTTHSAMPATYASSDTSRAMPASASGTSSAV